MNLVKQKKIHGSIKLFMSIFIISGFTSSLFAPPITTVPVTLLTDTLPNGVPGELRYAINESNANNPGVGPCASCNGPSTPNHNIIQIQTAGILTPLTDLPTITEPVLIDGTTAPGWVANTNTAQSGPNTATLTFQIDGPGPVFDPAGPQYGLRLGTGSSGSTIQGISFTNWAVVTFITLSGFVVGGAGIRIDSDNNAVLGCYLGADLSGASAPNFTAVWTLGANNSIGDGTAFGRNLISGQFYGNGTVRDNGTNTLISGNTINLNKAGTAVLMPDARIGVIFNATGSQMIGNVIAGHSAVNADIIGFSSNILIRGNYIGTDVTGTTSITPQGLGIWIGEVALNGYPTNFIIDSNTISGNTFGVVVGENSFSFSAANGTIITNNFIGTDPSGSFAVPNQFDGVWVKFGQDTYFNNNTISGNGRYGIRLGKSQHSNVKGNWIGTNIRGADLGNGADGIYMGGQGVGIISFGDIIGGAKAFTTPRFLGENNMIQFNKGNGIKTVGYVQNAMIDGNTISNNALNGIQLGKNASNNVIGSFQNAGNVRLMGDISSQGNVANPASALGGGNSIFDNGGDGIRVLSANSNIIQGNIITNNPGVGINMVDSSHNLVGANDPASSALLPPFLNIPNNLGNIVTGNGGPGVVVDQETGNATDNSILSNQIVDNNGNGIQFVS